MKVLVTGASGFIGKNLVLHLAERTAIEVVQFTRSNSLAELSHLLEGVDFVFHLAGVNRPQDEKEFVTGNADLTSKLIKSVEYEMQVRERKISIVYASSTQAASDNLYGSSKRLAEDALRSFSARTGAASYIFRLPNVFGKWCRPNYNSVIATFCHNIARGLPIKINDPLALLTVVYVDDVVEHLLQIMDGVEPSIDHQGFSTVTPQYTITVGELAAKIEAFRTSRDTLITERVGADLTRALYCTYVSYLPRESFTYHVPMHADARGVFVEMLRTPDCGQFSFFTAHPGITRGGHYHHSKTEKFLVIKGEALFKFRHMNTGETHQLVTSGRKAEIVETVPGWTHDITNIGSDELVVMLWANEVYDINKPDTYAQPL